MKKKRNALIDITRVAAAVGIILSHVDMTSFGAVGLFFSRFLTVRFSLMFFLTVIGFYVEKDFQAGRQTIRKRVASLVRSYGMWSLVYLALSFVMLVLIGKMPLDQYLISRVKSFLFSGSYYHFWFYPAVIYALLFIGGVKRLLGHRALRWLLPLAVVLYIVGLLGTGYLPIGRQIPVLRDLYGTKSFETIMHLVFLGFPAVVFGMAGAHGDKDRPGGVLLATAAYVAECVLLCLLLGWRDNPQMLISAPMLAVLFLRWAQSRCIAARNVNPAFLRTVSACMYNAHPLLLAALAAVTPGLNALTAFAVCVIFSAVFGGVIYSLRKNRFFALFA